MSEKKTWVLDALTTAETGQVCVRCPDSSKALVLTVVEAQELLSQVSDGLRLLKAEGWVLYNMSDVDVEDLFPGALRSWDRDVGVLRERTSFYRDGGHLYGETSSGSRYYWSKEDEEWFDS